MPQAFGIRPLLASLCSLSSPPAPPADTVTPGTDRTGDTRGCSLSRLPLRPVLQAVSLAQHPCLSPAPPTPGSVQAPLLRLFRFLPLPRAKAFLPQGCCTCLWAVLASWSFWLTQMPSVVSHICPCPFTALTTICMNSLPPSSPDPRRPCDLPGQGHICSRPHVPVGADPEQASAARVGSGGLSWPCARPSLAL